MCRRLSTPLIALRPPVHGRIVLIRAPGLSYRGRRRLRRGQAEKFEPLYNRNRFRGMIQLGCLQRGLTVYCGKKSLRGRNKTTSFFPAVL